jgi:hypothetical protein
VRVISPLATSLVERSPPPNPPPSNGEGFADLLG